MRSLVRLTCLTVLPLALGAQDTRAPRPQQDNTIEFAQEKRIALVIGNSSYKDAPLKNPVNDARAITEALKKSGFAVTELENATRNQMREAIRGFGARIAEGGVGLFYFAGHGMQVKGRNFLVPVGADIATEDEVAGEAVEVDAILAKMETARNRLNILILDACRNNPFGRSFRSTQQGLAQVDAPTGTFVAFATAPGRTAADGTGANGLFTEALLRQFQTPGLTLENVFKHTRAEVLKASAQQQTPWENSSIVGDFYFVPGAAATVSTATLASAVPPPPTEATASSPALSVKGAPEPTAAEVKLLDLIREDRTGTGPVKKAAKPLAAKGSIYGKYALGWASKGQGYYQANRTGAKQGIPLAMVFHGEFLAESPVSPDDPMEARRWLNKAIELGEPHAKFVLGKLLILGKLGPKDVPAGERLFAELTREYSTYCSEVGKFFWNDVLDLIPHEEAAAKGLAYYQRAADLGEAEAMYTLGQSYDFVGWNTPVDPIKAEHWFTLGAAYGNVECMEKLGGLYLVGKAPIRQDKSKALEWYERAVAHGSFYAAEELANLYRDGKEIPQDLPQAIALYRKAAEQGFSTSMNSLGEMYEKGTGVPQSYSQAYFWYVRACDSIGGNEKQKQDRDRVAPKLTPAERAKVEAQASKLKPKDDD